MNGKVIYEDTFFIIPRYIRKLPGMILSYIDVYETIFQFWNKGLTCYLSNGAIVERTGVSLTQVKDALLFFETKGELRRQTIGTKRYLIKPEVRIEIEQVAGPAAIGSRPSGQEVAGPAATEYKEVEYKEDNKPDIYNARENEKFLTTKPEEKKAVIDSTYEYPDTYYKSDALQTTSPSKQFNLTLKEESTFEDFWNVYPLKKGKERAQLMWFSEGCHLNANKIIQKLIDQVKRDHHFLQGFAPNPCKYIMEKRYEDEIFEGKKIKFRHDVNDISWASDLNKSIFEL